MTQTKITPENWKEVMPVGTIFRSAMSGLKYRVTETTRFLSGDKWKFRVTGEEKVDSSNGADPWIVYNGKECEIISTPEYCKQNINFYQIY